MAISTKPASWILTSEEQSHLTAIGIKSMQAMRRRVDDMLRSGAPTDISECLECKEIAQKLKLWPEE